MTATEIIEQIKSLSADERAQVTKYVVEHYDSWIPESFKRGMAEAEAGRFADMETVLSGTPPPARRKKWNIVSSRPRVFGTAFMT